jgi:hypothetical protein
LPSAQFAPLSAGRIEPYSCASEITAKADALIVSEPEAQFAAFDLTGKS